MGVTYGHLVVAKQKEFKPISVVKDLIKILVEDGVVKEDSFGGYKLAITKMPFMADWDLKFKPRNKILDFVKPRADFTESLSLSEFMRKEDFKNYSNGYRIYFMLDGGGIALKLFENNCFRYDVQKYGFTMYITILCTNYLLVPYLSDVDCGLFDKNKVSEIDVTDYVINGDEGKYMYFDTSPFRNLSLVENPDTQYLIKGRSAMTGEFMDYPVFPGNFGISIDLDKQTPNCNSYALSSYTKEVFKRVGIGDVTEYPRWN